MAKPKILVVDDERVIRDLFELTSKKSKKWDLTAVSSAKEAIEKVKTQDFDIIFMDIIMPGKDGIEAVTEIKKIKPDIPVVMMTGFGEKVLEKKKIALEAGVKAVLDKPFDVDEILSGYDSVIDLIDFVSKK